jgi:uncharacterized protein (DUF1800 family)
MSSVEAYIAANRFGYGASQNTISTINGSPKDWLIAQLKPYDLPVHPWTSLIARQQAEAYRQQQKATKKQQKESTAAMMSMTPEISIKDISNQSDALGLDTFLHSISTAQPLQARLLDFFSNHFSVSITNRETRLLAPTLEREAILPHLTGSFTEMLLAVETHPAMLLYLNNNVSVGPNSRVGKRRKKKGLNENLAREILELHTLGVNGGYSQQDVTEFAKAITGLTIGNTKRNESPGFVFRKATHEPGERTILGVHYAANDVTMGQAQAILKMLANHPSTATHICTKLAQHFISDNPDPKSVERMVRAWHKTSGHIPSVVKELILHPTSWLPAASKFKTPRDLVISACRACELSETKPSLPKMLAILGQAPFSAGSPAGYSDESLAWSGPNPLMTRIEWANHFAGQVKLSPMHIAQHSIGPLLSEHTQQHIERAESKRQAIALLLMSPEFQRR